MRRFCTWLGGTYKNDMGWIYKTTYIDPCLIVPVNPAYVNPISNQIHYSRWSSETPAEMYGEAQDSVLYTETAWYWYYHFYKYGSVAKWDTVPGEDYEMQITVDKGLSWDGIHMPEFYRISGNAALEYH